METVRHRRRIAVLALLTVLAATMSIPARVPSALAATPTELRGTTPAVSPAANDPEDEALVKASLQQPIQDEVFYFVMPDRFNNGNPANDAGGDSGSTTADVLRHGYLPTDKGYFHGGDLAGLEDKLDYLQSMGISAVWMTPVFKNRAVQGDGTIAGSSAAYHGYWITDFTNVDPRLGVNADLQTLVTAAHARGMKVFFDIITNHTADVIDYEGDEQGYRNKTNAPYKDASGTVFDDKTYAGTNTFPDLDPNTSFPYKPVFRTPADATVKVPAWLNDPTNYHNRGDSTFAGESSEYGDFFGLDDLFTEQPDVAQGMVDIYKQWITTYGIDGYRIDTVKHVNMEFWQKFGPEILAHAQAVGKPDFFMYGEVFSGDVPFLSSYTTEGKLPAVLDFGFQGSARGFASNSGATNNLKNFFEADDYYTDADSNAYSLPTFLGNHDMGRFGYFLKQDNAGATDGELLSRDKLANALMFFSRGMPVIYYGDEQGFTGDGGDKDAREDMFPSQVASYNDNDLIGTTATTADDNFDTDHPLYQAIQDFSQLRTANKALRRGAQIQRYSTDAAGIFAFSRIERDEKIEYVVAFNNAETEQTATFKVYQPNTSFTAVLPSGAPALTSSAQSEITVTVPALGVRIYKAATAVPASTAAPSITMAVPMQDAEVTGRFEVAATVGSDQLAEVTFAVKAGDATEYTVIGTDNNAPYRVFYDASKLAEGTALVFKAIVNDLSGAGVIGNLKSATVGALVGSDEPGGGGGTCPAPTSVAIHYQRPAGDYGDYTSSDFNNYWSLYVWTGSLLKPTWKTSLKPTGTDAFGVYWDVPLEPGATTLNYIIHKGNTKDQDADQVLDLATHANGVWIKQGDATLYSSRAAAQNLAIIHYQRPAGDYGDYTSSDFNNYWSLYVWTGSLLKPTWKTSLKPTGTDAFGVYWDVPLEPGATTLSYIIHKGNIKDQDADQELDFATYGKEVWVLQGVPGFQPSPQDNCGPSTPTNTGDLSKQKAHWVACDTITWDITANPAYSYTLHYDANAGITLDSSRKVSGGQALALTLEPIGLSPEQKAKFPHLATFTTLKIRQEDQVLVQQILTGQFVVSATDASGTQIDATGLQIPGVLDDLYTYNGALGVTFEGDVPSIRLWAPTAKSVKLHLFADSNSATTSTVSAMTVDPASGVWSIVGAADWVNTFYLFEVEVYVPSTRRIEHNMVTDPYSLSLATNSTRSQIVNLAAASLMPAGWTTLTKPPLAAPEDIVLYELQIRDFSINDLTVPEAHRGTYLAFTDAASNGNQHLRALAESGLTHIHLLPTFDIATINENKAERQEPDAALLSTYPPTSTLQQAAVAAVVDKDGFNWGYDPYHYTTPEGSYSTNPDGATRILEFRSMVKALSDNGLRVVMDVVYNHTTASGQAQRSVLDRVVPGYYQRLNLEGTVETSTCCANTATEHAMMQKLMVDSVVTWAREYKIDGFRFDLMGHHMKADMEQVRDALAGLTLEKDGVDGSKIYVYGEGWNFGEVANNQRGTNATQLNMPGTGIGVFNDRLRDAARGGGPFGDPQVQGFLDGLFYDPNTFDQGTADAQKARLLLYQDQIRVGLAGNLRNYTFTDRNGDTVAGKDIDYNGSPAGYTLDPQETINYVEAHDNETLWDAIAWKAPASATVADRVRMQNLGNSMIALTQGIPFFQAGQDMLRSKSLDRNSYNSGDWFNRLDFTYASNNWGVGLPPSNDNQAQWPAMAELLGNPALKPSQADIEMAVAHFREMLEIRQSSRLFRLETSTAISENLTFLNTGPDQIPGLIVMRLSDLGTDDLDPGLENIVVLFNANDETQTFTMPALPDLHLHEVQLQSADALVRATTYNSATGTFTIPPRTTAVFTDEMLQTFFPYLFR